MFCAPAEPYANQKFLDEDNEAIIIDAVEPLPGVLNLHEKSIPIFRLKYPSYVGANNLRERSQIPSNLLGIRNLHEKGMLPEFTAVKTSPSYEHNPFLRKPKNNIENF